jgi:hypothetical protein
MTVSTTIIKNFHNGNASTTNFAYQFRILEDTDLLVIIRTNSTGAETTKTLSTHYTVAGAGDASGGSITFTVGNTPAIGETVVIRRNVPQTQAIDYIANDPFPAETHEEGLDRGTMVAQQVAEESDRSIKLSRTNTMTSTEFTVGATDRANKVLAFDSAGEISVTQELGTFKGSDATTTTAAYVQRDIIKSTTAGQLNNVYICVADSIIGDTLTDTDHFALLVDAVSAATSATAASSSATAAASSATDAQTAQTAAELAETNAETAETNAETAETNAATSETNAANSATASANSASAAAATFDLFDDSYLGAKASNPSVDNDGNALQDGALYFDTTNDVMKVYNLANTTWYQLTPTVSNQTNINTVAGISSDVSTVAGISSDIQAVENISSNVTTVAGIDSNVTTVAGISGNVSTVAGISSNVTTVAGVSGNVTTVAGISSNVTTVANDATDIGTVATNLTGTNTIGTVAGSIANVNNVGGSIANVNTVATNLASVNNFGEVYRISATAPITSLNSGDLYFDTSTNILNVYGASGWQNAGSSVNGTSQRYNYTATNAQTTFTGADNNGNTLAYDAGYVDVYLNGVKLLNGTDVTVTSGSSVVLASGATTGDVVDIVAYGTFSVASLNADNLDSGTVPSARLGTITNFTSTGIDDNSTSTTITIDSSNRVGIGTASPEVSLHIKSNSGIRAERFANSAGSANLDLNKSRNATIGSHTILQNGDGIGAIIFRGSDGTNYENAAAISAEVDGTPGTNDMPGRLTFLTTPDGANAYTERMRITSSGNVGIGTSSPDNILMVSSDGASASAQPLSIVNPSRYGTSDSVELEFGMGRANDTNNLNFPIIGLQKEQQWQGASTNVDASVIFKSVSNQTASERMRITSSGNVGVGTTAPDAKFQSGAITSGSGATVGNQAGFFVGAKSKFASATGLYQNQVCILDTANGAVAGSGGALTFAGYQDADSPTFFATIEGVKNNSTNDNYAGSLRFYTRANGVANMTEGMRIHPDGIVSAPSGIALGIGLSSNSSNVLDDYEEGTWTPSLSTAGGTLSATFPERTGKYTKIGNVVYYEFFIETSAFSGGSGAITFSGLPFTAQAGRGAVGLATGSRIDLGLESAGIIPTQNSSNFTIQIKNSTGTGSSQNLANLDASDWSNLNPTNLYGSGYYRTNA